MGYGEQIDKVVGSMSRLLHIRSAKVNTIGDLDPYFDLSPAELFPEPPPWRHGRAQAPYRPVTAPLTRDVSRRPLGA